MTADRYDALDAVVGLARTLRAAGVEAAPDRVSAAVTALAELDPSSRRDVYWAGRLTLCAAHDDIATYDRVFASYFGSRPRYATDTQYPSPATPLRLLVGGDDADGSANQTSTATAAASRLELLRRRDLAELDAGERAEVARLLAAFRLSGEPRRTRRRGPAARGTVDRHRTMRMLLRTGGDPFRLPRQDRRQRPRRVVLLVDVSGSMRDYADALLRFAHVAHRRLRGPQTEVFAAGTRLTRLTRELSSTDPHAALVSASAAIPDWSGGTRLGETLRAFLDRWGQRGVARGAVVVVMSDGWERGDVSLLAGQMARLRRLAHRVVWANPRAGRAGFAPLAAGMAAALPYVDDLVAGNSVEALEQLAGVVAGAREPVRRA